jgi:hypothetical protein
MRLEAQVPRSKRIEPGTLLPEHGSAGLARTKARLDNPTMILTLDAKRRLTLPASRVPAQPGDHFQAEFDSEEDAVVWSRRCVVEFSDSMSRLLECVAARSALVLHGRAM